MIKSKFTFFQVQVKSIFTDTSKLAEPGFCDGPKVLNAVNMVVSICKFITSMLDPIVFFITEIYKAVIDSLKISDVNFEKNSIITKSRKTKKSMASRPVSAEVMTELSKYVCSVDVGQERLFNTKFNHRKWRRICTKAGLADLKFHDLRKTFCSLLAQNGVSTAVTQRLLEHSSPNLTNKIYTNIDPVLRQSVEKLPIRNWL